MSKKLTITLCLSALVGIFLLNASESQAWKLRDAMPYQPRPLTKEQKAQLLIERGNKLIVQGQKLKASGGLRDGEDLIKQGQALIAQAKK